MISQACDYIRSRGGGQPKAGVVLGSGLGGFAGELADRVEIPYGSIPGWPCSTAAGHAGKLVLGRLGALEVAVMSGRVHLYEGYTPQQVTFGVRVLGMLGVRSMVSTNAAGGINLELSRGGLVLISDHINLQGSNPLVGPNDESLGPRFPDMSEAYSRRYREIALDTGHQLGIPLHEGVYAAMLGPSFETPAEIRMLRMLGGDAVGMSTVPEALVAHHAGMEVLAISTITNTTIDTIDAAHEPSHEEVQEAGQIIVPRLSELLLGVVERLA